MRALFVLATILAVVAQAMSSGKLGPTWRHLEGYTFEKYCDDFSRNYEGEEYKKRESIFNKNLDEIKSHNSDVTQSWKKGINQFSDWSKDEFKKYNTYKFQGSKGPKPDFVHKAPKDAKVPSMVDYRTWTAPEVLTGVKNQGACGGCWGFSATESVESYFALLTGQLPVLSVQQIISCTPEPMQGCGGGNMRNGWDYVKGSTGLNEEWLYPFVNFFAKNETLKATQKCQNITKDFLPNFPWYPKAGVTGWGTVTVNSAPDTLHALAVHGPHSISVAAQPWMHYEGGILQNNASLPANETWGIDHGVQLVGYGHDFDMDMDYWIVRNSWGTSWGEDGFIRLARPAKEPCGIEPYVNEKICGTSGVLSGPDRPVVSMLKKKNV